MYFIYSYICIYTYQSIYLSLSEMMRANSNPGAGSFVKSLLEDIYIYIYIHYIYIYI